MTTDERLENLEKGLASARRLNRRLPTSAAVCLGLIFTWGFFAQPSQLGTAQAEGPANPYEAEVTRLQAEVNLLKRENERLRKELDEAKKDKSATPPTDAQGPSAPEPAATQPPGPDEPPTAVRIPGLPETDSSWWRDPEALVKHMKLRESMSATNPQASVWMWLHRHNYFTEQRVRWKLWLHSTVDSPYFDKDTAAIEYYRCLGEAEKFGKEAEKYRKVEEKYSKEEIQSGVKKIQAPKREAVAAWYRGEVKAWKILMDAGGGLSLYGSVISTRGKGFSEVHLVLPGERSAAAYLRSGVVLVQGRIVALGVSFSPEAILKAALTGNASSLSVD
jgi:hypothetical protein